MKVLQNLHKFRVGAWKCYRTHRSPVYCGTGGHDSQKFRAGTKSAVPIPRVLWHGACRTHRKSGYGYECSTQLTEVPGTGTSDVLQNFHKFRISRSSGYCGTGVQNFQKFRAGMKILYPYPRYLRHWRGELTEVPGTGMNVLQNLEVPGTGNTQVSIRPGRRGSI